MKPSLTLQSPTHPPPSISLETAGGAGESPKVVLILSDAPRGHCHEPSKDAAGRR